MRGDSLKGNKINMLICPENIDAAGMPVENGRDRLVRLTARGNKSLPSQSVTETPQV